MQRQTPASYQLGFLTMFCLIWVTDVQCLYSIIAQNRAPQGKRIINWRFKFGFKNLNFILSPFLWWLITDFYKKLTIFDEMAKIHKLNILKRKKCIRNKHTEIEISKLLLDIVISQTHQGLKRVTIMFAFSDAHKYSLSKVPYLERQEKTDLSNPTWHLQKRNSV